MLAIVKENFNPGISIKEVADPIPGVNPIINIKAAAICGSDIHMYQDMTAYKHVNTPVIMGHEACGVVVDSGKSSLKIGQKVVIDSVLSCGNCYYCRTGRENLCANRKTVGQEFNGVFAPYASLPERVCIPVPNELPFELGACAEPLGVALRGIEQANIKPGDSVCIIGPGPIGLMELLLCKLSGASKIAMVGTKMDENRLQVARQLGATDIIYSPEDIEKYKAKFSTVFEWSGARGGLVSSVDFVAPGGTIIAGAIYSQDVSINVTSLVRREIALKTSRSRVFSTWQRAIELLCTNTIDLSKIITHRFYIDESQKAFELAAAKESVKTILFFQK